MMKQKGFRRLLSVVLAVLMLALMIPLSYVTTVSAAETVLSAFDAQDVLNGLAHEGDITISIVRDIDIQLDESFNWRYDANTGRWLWAILGNGYKTLKLNGHTLAVDDALVDTARYTKENQYNAETGKIEEKDVFIANSFRQKAALICIPVASGLYVDGTAGGKVMMTAKVPDNEQMMDNNIVMQRDVFLIEGGSLTVNGGTYQAGRRKDHYVNNAIKCNSDWNWEQTALGTIAQYWGYGEYSINGTAVYAYGGSVSVYGGTFIGHGFEINNKNCRNSVFEIVNSARLNFYDGNVQGYSGADCFKIGISANTNFYSGWTKTYAPDRYLWPRGANRVNADESYCIAVDVGPGNATYPISKTGRTEKSANGGILYAPEESVAVDGLRWENGTSSQIAYGIGASKKAVFNFGDLYYGGHAVGNERHNIDYAFSLSEKQSDGKWKAVSGWIANGSEKKVDLLKFNGYMSPGGTYRLTAKATESWSSTHNFTHVFTAENALSFTTDSLTVNQVSLRIDDPVAGEWLAKKDAVACLTEGYSVESIRWSNGSYNYSADSTVSASAGIKYKATVTLSVNKGVTVAGGVTAKVNSASAGITVNGGTMVVTYTFPETVKVIRNVEFRVNAPAENTKPASSVDIRSDKHFALANWSDALRFYSSTDGVNYTKMSVSASFVLNRYYKAEIDIVSNSEYDFAVDATGIRVVPDIRAIVNSITCDTGKIYEQAPQDAVTVICDFGLLTQDNSIKTVEITGIDAPYPGNTPDYFAYTAGDGYAIDLNENEGTTQNGVFWYYIENNKKVFMAPDETFKAGIDYTVNVIVAATEKNFKLDSNGYPQIDALVGENIASAGTYGDKPAKDRICVCYEFAWQTVKVSTVEINGMTLPQAGAYPDTKLSVSNEELYKITTVQWYEGNYEAGTPVSANATFGPSDTYAVMIQLSRNLKNSVPLSEFTSPVEVYINGIKADSADITSNKSTVCIYMNFSTGGVVPHTPGDINGDGAVNNKDLTRLFQYLSDWDVEVNAAALDVNGDGSVNNKDLTRLFQYLSDWDVEIF